MPLVDSKSGIETSSSVYKQDSFRSCLVCAVGVLCNVITYGVVNSFGVIYPALLDEFKQGEAKTAWIGSMCMGVVCGCGPIGGFLNRKYGPRLTSIAGVLVCSLGLFISSQMKLFVVIFFTYGLLFAFGCSLIYTSVFNIVPKYFLKRRALAAGLISTGPGAGVFLMSQVLELSLSAFGWRGALMVAGGLITTLVIPIFVMFRENVETSTPAAWKCGGVWVRHINPPPVWKNKQVIIYSVVGSVYLLGCMIPQVHIVRYCEGLGIGVAKASRLYLGFGVASMLTRVLVGLFADHPSVNPLYFLRLGVFGSGLTALLCPLAKDFLSLMLNFTFLGLADGLLGTSFNIVLLGSARKGQYGKVIGFSMAFQSIGLISGPPLGGLIVEQLGIYEAAFYLAGSVNMFGFLISFLLSCFPNQEYEDLKQGDLNQILLDESLVVTERETVL